MTKKDDDREIVVHIQGLGSFEGLPHRSTLIRWVETALRTSGEIGLRFVKEDEGRELNKNYRGKDYATNVLTFDYQTEPTVEADIVICVPVLKREAEEQNKTFKEHLAHLIIHGVLHALGYDHMNEKEAAEMEQHETDILFALGFQPPYPDRSYTPRELQ